MVGLQLEQSSLPRSAPLGLPLPDTSTPVLEDSPDTSAEPLEKILAHSDHQDVLLPLSTSVQVASSTASGQKIITKRPSKTAVSTFKHLDLDSHASPHNAIHVEDSFTTSVDAAMDSNKSLDPPISSMLEGTQASPLSAFTEEPKVAIEPSENIRLEPRDVSAESMAIDAPAIESLDPQTQSQNQTEPEISPPHNPAQPAAQNDIRPLIPVPQAKDIKMFTLGYNHKMFVEGAKIISDKSMDDFFDFAAYTDENSTAGSKAMPIFGPDSKIVDNAIQYITQEGDKESFKMVVEDVVMQDARENAEADLQPSFTRELIKPKYVTQDVVMADEADESDLSTLPSEFDVSQHDPAMFNNNEGTKEVEVVVNEGKKMDVDTIGKKMRQTSMNL